VAPLDLAAELVRHRLHAIANAENRDPEMEHRFGCLVGGFFVHAGMAPGEDDALEQTVGRVVTDPFVGHIAGMHLAIDMRLAHAPGDELGDLGAEI
jgi:hypothetical protein